jgi:CheY-like chemotaxis protein
VIVKERAAVKKGNIIIYGGQASSEGLIQALTERGWEAFTQKDPRARAETFPPDLIIVSTQGSPSVATYEEIRSTYPGIPIFTYATASTNEDTSPPARDFSYLGIACTAEEIGKMAETMLYAYRRGGRPAPPESMAHYERALDVLFEINSPLSVVLANADLLLSSEQSVQPHARSLVKEIRLAVDSIVNLTKEFGDRKSHLSPAVAKEEPPPSLYSKEKRKILVVDDDEAVCKVIKRTLGSEYEVFVAHDGNEALRMAEESYFDLFIVDLHMPHMRGTDLIKEFKKRQKITRPILVITGYLDDDDAMEAVKKGAHGCFYKPLNLEEIQAFVRQILV